MSWMVKLYETYEQGMKLDLPGEKLMPISHTQQNAHINIVIDGEGNFKRATLLEKEKIVLPATESSAGRTSGESPHPLADKLQYIAKDYQEYKGIKKSYFDSYRTLLAKWCDSAFSHRKAKAVYRYIEKGKVISDLINSKIIDINNIDVLLNKDKIETGSALVCWTVEIEGDSNDKTWLDKSLQQSWINFDTSSGEVNEGLCYVRGDKRRLAVNHPARLRHNGDKAKLISSNDASGFTYRGRFILNTQASGVGLDVTQKAHNALRWLISRQGYRNGSQVIVAWAVSGKDVPNPMDPKDLSINWDDIKPVASKESTDELPPRDHSHDIGQSYALQLNKKMAGYLAKLDELESIIIMAIESATPGRMSITYYREYIAKEFIARLEAWQRDFAWYHKKINTLTSNSKQTNSKIIWFISAPTPFEIAEAAYGKPLNDTLKQNLYERLMPCILDERPIPIDIVNSCIHRAVNPFCHHSIHSDSSNWEWEHCLAVACALYRGFYSRHPDKTKRRNYSMSLEINNISRDYLYGRLLAVAERIEQIALNVAGENRMS